MRCINPSIDQFHPNHLHKAGFTTSAQSCNDFDNISAIIEAAYFSKVFLPNIQFQILHSLYSFQHLFMYSIDENT